MPLVTSPKKYIRLRNQGCNRVQLKITKIDLHKAQLRGKKKKNTGFFLSFKLKILLFILQVKCISQI